MAEAHEAARLAWEEYVSESLDRMAGEDEKPSAEVMTAVLLTLLVRGLSYWR